MERQSIFETQQNLQSPVSFPMQAKDTKEKKEPEATFDLLSNPARVMKPQLQVIKMENPTSTEKALYAPIKDISIGGKENQSLIKHNQ